LNAVVVRIDRPHVAGRVDRDAGWLSELPVTGAKTAEGLQERTGARELLDAVVALIANPDVAGRIQRDTDRQAELSIAASRTADRPDEDQLSRTRLQAICREQAQSDQSEAELIQVPALDPPPPAV